MFREEIRHKESLAKTILLLTDCWMGALAAGRFTARMLFDENTRIIILNTYQPPAASALVDQTIAGILRQAAEKDIETLWNHLVH